MPKSTTEMLQDLRIAHQIFFRDELKKKNENDYLKYSDYHNEQTDVISKNWIGLYGGFEKWENEVVYKDGIQIDEQTFKTEKWHKAISIDYNHVRYQRYVEIDRMVKALFSQARRFINISALKTMANAKTSTIFSGKTYFATDHNVFGDKSATPVTFSNSFDLELNTDNLFTLVSKMMSLQDADGESYNHIPNLLVIHPSKLQTAKKILENQLSAQGGTNEGAGLMSFIVNPYFDENRWDIYDTTQLVKPIWTHNNLQPEVEYDDSLKVKKDELGVVAHLQFKQGLSLPELGMTSTPATTP
jgi:phage major head subunit gpT-like protein